MLVAKADSELQIAYGAVYVPDEVDSHGDFMNAEEIRKMAHKFLASGRVANVDLNHNNKKTGSSVVESYIVKEGDPDFKTPGTWVVGVHIPDETLWKAVKKGLINSFSLEAAVRFKKDQPVTQKLPQSHMITGKTDQVDGHTHTFEIFYDDDGNLTGGRTSIYKGKNGAEHFHVIKRVVATEIVKNHAHRFNVVKGYRLCEGN